MFLLPQAPLDNPLDLDIPPAARARSAYIEFVEISAFLDAGAKVLRRGLDAVGRGAFVGGQVADAQGEGVFVVAVLSGAVVG